MLQLLVQQLLLDPGRHRTEHQLGREFGDGPGEPGALHLTVPNLTEKCCIPGEFDIKGLGAVGIEVAGEDPQR